MANPAPPLPTMSFEGPLAFETWLEGNHDTSSGIWMQIAKKDSGIPSITYGEALDIVLCYGWIDGQRKGLDDDYFLQKYTPRRRASMWSKRNVDKVAVLIEAGRMQPAGLAQVQAAQADGRWERAYAGPATMHVPADFQAAIDANAEALEFFGSLTKSQRFAFLFRVETAKRAETRARRIEQFVQLLAQRRTL